jgi:hypothetical protein
LPEAESRHELVLNDLRGMTDSELREMVAQEIEALRKIGGGNEIEGCYMKKVD